MKFPRASILLRLRRKVNSTVSYFPHLRILGRKRPPKTEPKAPIKSPMKNWMGARNPKKTASAYPCSRDTETGTARILTTRIEYAKATNVDNRSALRTLSRSESTNPATKELKSAASRPISQLNPKSYTCRDWLAKNRSARSSALACSHPHMKPTDTILTMALIDSTTAQLRVLV